MSMFHTWSELGGNIIYVLIMGRFNSEQLKRQCAKMFFPCALDHFKQILKLSEMNKDIACFAFLFSPGIMTTQTQDARITMGKSFPRDLHT